MNILFISLGCDKNLVDTEKMLGLLKNDGYLFTDDEESADIVVVNTCCFIGDAKEESINTILEMAELKNTARCRGLIVTGCLAQRYREEVMKEIPEVDACVGTTAYEDISRVIRSVLEGGREMCYRDVNHLPDVRTSRIVTTGGHYAFLKIAEGCDKHCTYCVIPGVRGRYRSVPLERLLGEAKELARAGVKELILVAQETTVYGTDLYGEKSLPRLLRELCRICGIQWIRILYCYPEEITPELIETVKTEDKVCKYLDIPIQHASDRILKRMGRRTDRSQLKSVIETLRRQIPDIVIRTTLICGFPGETKEDHEILMDFVDEMEFERLGVFAYSQEEDTPAAGFADQVDEEVKALRRDEIMELQQEISLEKSEAMIGRVMEVMIEGKVADENAYVGRTYMDAPGVDGMVFVNTEELLMSGDFVRVKITGALEYDLIGEMWNESAK